MDSGWSLANNVYQAMVNVVGIDRIVFTTDYPYANMKATRQFFDQMPISHEEKAKIAYLNAERLFVNLEMETAPRVSRHTPQRVASRQDA
jgi:predicted TIM-barrel fold metal-dependent hydrolase